MATTTSPQRVTERPPDLERHPSRLLGLAPWAALVVGLVAWAVSLLLINLGNLGPWGLLPKLTVFWFLGLALIAGVCGYALLRPGALRPALLTAGLASLTLVLYATTTLVENAPRQAWTYKHIGVTRYILTNGTIDPSIDIYQRWPGAFAFGALLSRLFGVSDPTAFAAWAQLFYAVLLGLLVFALASSLSTSRRAAWAAVLLFTCTNWTGQMYYAPQPLALALHLGILLLVLRFLRCPPNRLGRRVERLFGGGPVEGGERRPATVATSRATRALVVVCILLMHTASTTTHQLTPFITLISLVALLALGYIRSWVLVIGMAAITVAYLVPNMPFLEQNYGLINTLNPLDNFRARVEGVTPQLGVKVLLGRLAVVLSLLVGLLALGGMWSRWRRGDRSVVVLCAALIASPLLLGFVQNYGGEAQLRAFLFASPWCAIAVGWLTAAAVERARPTRLVVTAGVVFALVLTLFVPNSFGSEDVYNIPRSEVQACQWLSAHSPPRSTFVLSVSGFPSRCAATYNDHVGPSRGDTPTLLSTDPRFAANDFSSDTRESVNTVWRKVRGYGKNTRLIFSTSQENYARAWNLFGGDAGYRRMQRAVGTSHRFTLVYKNADTHVYALVLPRGWCCRTP